HPDPNGMLTDVDFQGGDVLPKVAPELAHALAFTNEPPGDEIIGPAKLIEDREKPLRRGRGYSVLLYPRQDFTRKRDRHGLSSRFDLLQNQRIEGPAKSVEDPKEKDRFHQGTV